MARERFNASVADECRRLSRLGPPHASIFAIEEEAGTMESACADAWDHRDDPERLRAALIRIANAYDAMAEHMPSIRAAAGRGRQGSPDAGPDPLTLARSFA